MKYYFPIHLNGDNRGCEAIAKGTALVLGAPKADMIGYCTNIPLDQRLGIEDYYTLVPFRKATTVFRMKNKLHSLMVHDKVKKQNFVYSYEYDLFLDRISDEDIMLSTGGDMFCYANCQVNYTVDYLAAKGKKTVLWGCSIGEENLTPEKIISLNNFTALVARESLTLQLFEKMGLKKVFLLPDPAFALNVETCEIPEWMHEGEVIGINLSNFVGHDVSAGSMLGNNIRNLMTYILKHTSMNVMLVPHVLWPGQDDRAVCSDVYKEYMNTGRVYLLDSDKFNYCQLRYIISKCSLFIGARTHAVISAYSTCVPALALGYSIKSKGIANDLGLPETSVINSVKVTSPYEMANGFAVFLKQADNIRTQLEAVIPEYKSQLNEGKNLFTII